MSARAIRRTFAAPFIITVATMSPALADDKVPPGTNPPAPDTVKLPPVKPQKPEPSKVERHWTVLKDNAKGAKATDCLVMQEGSCPKVDPGKPIPPCNPPPPIKYTCPDGFTDKTINFKIVLRVGATECFQERAPITCPKGASCNPPPPRKLACPK